MKNSLFPSKLFTMLAVLLCVLYALIMIQLLFNRTSTPGWNPYRYNFVPFRTIANYIRHYSHFNFETWFKNLFGNIVLFIPIGLFAPVINRSYLRFFRFAGLTLAILITIETVQLVTKVGSFDVDDLILNFTGAVLGVVCVYLLWGRKRRI